MIKQLSTVLIMNVSGGQRVSYTYDEVDEETGEVANANVKESFFAVQPALTGPIAEVSDWIRKNKLTY